MLHVTDPLRRLVAAVLARAARDVETGNGYAEEARRWLGGPVAAEYANSLGLHEQRLAEFVQECQD